VADMDFQTPEPIFNALRSSLDFGVIGYGLQPNTLQEAWLDCNELILDGRIHGSSYEFFLKEAKVALSDRAVFASGGEGFVRLDFGCPRSTLINALERMAKSINRR
jgi:cystathionine beta-lyase